MSISRLTGSIYQQSVLANRVNFQISNFQEHLLLFIPLPSNMCVFSVMFQPHCIEALFFCAHLQCELVNLHNVQFVCKTSETGTMNLFLIVGPK